MALSTDKLVVFTIRESAFEDEECNKEDADTNHAIFETRRAFLWCEIRATRNANRKANGEGLSSETDTQ